MGHAHIMLYPCIRCGGKAEIAVHSGEGAVFPQYTAICTQCGRITAPMSLMPEDAAAAWNSGAAAYCWTTTLPQETGWYWMRRAGWKPIIVHALVTRDTYRSTVMLLGDDNVREQVYASTEIEWSDRPILLPMDRPKAEESNHA